MDRSIHQSSIWVSVVLFPEDQRNPSSLTSRAKLKEQVSSQGETSASIKKRQQNLTAAKNKFFFRYSSFLDLGTSSLRFFCKFFFLEVQKQSSHKKIRTINTTQLTDGALGGTVGKSHHRSYSTKRRRLRRLL